MERIDNIIVTHSLDKVGKESYRDYLSHALCIGGRCKFLFNGKEFELRKGDVMIVRRGKLMEKIRPEEGFEVINVMVASEFIAASSPIQSNYGVRGQLALFMNPVMHLTPEQYGICRKDFDNIVFRLSQVDHHFHNELLMNAVQTMILDFFDFHSHLYQESDVSVQFANIMARFLALLENGEYRKNREVAWYADKLCITPKYLSQVTKEVSGYAAISGLIVIRYSTYLACSVTSRSPLSVYPICLVSHLLPILVDMCRDTWVLILRSIEDNSQIFR